MWLLLLFFLCAAPAWAEDLGELSANPAGLSGFSGLFMRNKGVRNRF